MTDKVKDPITEAILLVQQNSYDNDKALLTLGEALSDRVNLHSERIDMLVEMNLRLQNKILDLYQKIDTLTAIVHTHFTDTPDEGQVH
jgi:hypothetical protein